MTKSILMYRRNTPVPSYVKFILPNRHVHRVLKIPWKDLNVKWKYEQRLSGIVLAEILDLQANFPLDYAAACVGGD